MAGQTFTELTNQAQTIKNESTAGLNTATRVGTFMEDAIDSLKQQSESFTSALQFDKFLINAGSYNMSSGDLSLTLSGSGNIAGSKIFFTLTANGTGTLTVSSDFQIYDSSFTSGTAPETGTYKVWCFYDGSKVDIQLVEVTTIGGDTTAPTIQSIVIADDHTYADVTFSEGVYDTNGGSGALELADLNLTFAQNGGTATAWTESSVKQNDNTSEGSASNLVGGETIVRVFGSVTGVPDGNEILTVAPTNGTSIYDVAGNAMDAGQSAQDSFTASSPSNTLLTNLVSFFELDDATDSHGSNNGTVNSATSGTTGKVGNCYTFDGTDDYITANGVATSTAANNEGTIAFWCKPDSGTPAAGEIIVNIGDTNGDQVLYIAIVATGGVQAFFRNNAGTRWRLDTDNPVIATDTWVHVMLVQDGVSPVLYIDNVAVAQTFGVGTDKADWFNDMGAQDNFVIGSLNYNSSGYTNHFAGEIDEVGVWGDVLGTTDRAALYNSGNGLAYSSFSS